jgi:hypothetical protein
MGRRHPGAPVAGVANVGAVSDADEHQKPFRSALRGRRSAAAQARGLTQNIAELLHEFSRPIMTLLKFSKGTSLELRSGPDFDYVGPPPTKSAPESILAWNSRNSDMELDHRATWR